jgi:aminoethylphosphonate catabolism LysR family transcriptional regulator
MPLAPPSHAQLRAFLAVATARSFTEAARALGVSQPAVSMQVRSLEEAYGVELLSRGRRVEPTDLGRALLAAVRPIFALEVEAAEILGRAGGLLRGHLRVGADAPFVVVPVLAAFRAAHPGLSLQLSLGNSSQVLEDLLEGRTDVAAISDRVDDARLFAVAAEKSRQVVLVARAHPWASRRSIKIHELDGVPMVMREEGSMTRRAFEATAARARVAPLVVMELGSREAIQEAVAARIGVGVVIETERGHDSRLSTLPFSDVAIEHVTYVACLEERRRLRAIAAFFEVVPRLQSTMGAPPATRTPPATPPSPQRAARAAGKKPRAPPRPR